VNFIDVKSEIAQLNATPHKRIFWSIISDYDLKTAVCELVDNAIDVRARTQEVVPLEIWVDICHLSQTIRITDTAGGVGEDELAVLVSPGGSGNDPMGKSIGVFGVGSKRAVVALAQQTSIQTRKHDGRSFQIDVTDAWLASEEWDIPVYEIPPIDDGTTIVELTKLRNPLSEKDTVELRDHLSATYAYFLEDERTKLYFNGSPISPAKFETWAYPPGHEPRRVESIKDYGESGLMLFRVTGGLITDRLPELENYGVYIYCNGRLIARELKTRDVGYFNSAEAGVPHPDASICRVIVQMEGPARLMPWTSAKNSVNADSEAFREVRPIIVKLLSHFTTLSRRTKNDWENQIFTHSTGEIQYQAVDDVISAKQVKLAPLPRARRTVTEQLRKNNIEVIVQKPWTLGLLEAIAATEVIKRQRFDTGNRMSLIFLDSNFEIALKEFIVHSPSLFPPSIYADAKIKEVFKFRHQVVAEVAGKVPIPQDLLDRASHYYAMRNKLIHERASATVSDNDIKNYRNAIEEILTILFDLRF